MYYDRLRQKVRAARSKEHQRQEARALLDSLDVRQHIAPVYIPLHADIEAGAHRYYNLPGGRGSCKSSFASLEIVNGIMKDTTGHSNAIVFRLVAETMRESVFSQISWAIDTLGVGHLWRATVSPMRYEYIPTGAQIIFRGLDDASKLKSIKPKKGTFRYIWFEEFSELPGPNFTRNVLQSVMRGQGAQFVVFRTFNPPISKNNWANVFIQEPDERAITLLTDYTMIPPEWLGEAFLYEAERLKAVNESAYKHEYLGIPTGSGGEVFPHVEARTITDAEISEMGYFYFGLDFGFATDPAAFVAVSYDRKREIVYILDEIYQRHLSNAQLAEKIKARGYWASTTPVPTINPTLRGVSRNYYLICDSAEPKSVYDMKTAGIPAKSSYKRPGCVTYRIRWLQHRRIVIDPQRTPNAYHEFVNYEYETDHDGNFLADVPDKDNHSIDATAYALERCIFKEANSA